MAEKIEQKPPLVVIAGPTACRKSETAVRVAERIGGEIISADSMQIYRYMDIGTAKPTAEEMRGIPHHLVDELNPDEEYNIAVFQEKAEKSMDQIVQNGKTPILCGGTGFYISGLLRGTAHGQPPDEKIMEELDIFTKEYGSAALYERLKAADPAAADKIHPNNIVRVTRALAYVLETGALFSEHNRNEKQRTRVFSPLFFVLAMDRTLLYDRIEARIDKMMEAGLAGEVEGLLRRGYPETLHAMQGLGYKEIVPYVQGKTTREEAAALLKLNTRHYAKRQLTWFSGQYQDLPETVWLDASDKTEQLTEKIIEKIIERIGGRQ